jgi:hypothetical protein
MEELLAALSLRLAMKKRNGGAMLSAVAIQKQMAVHRIASPSAQIAPAQPSLSP